MNHSPVCRIPEHVDDVLPIRHFSRVYHRDRVKDCIATFHDELTHVGDAQLFVAAGEMKARINKLEDAMQENGEEIYCTNCGASVKVWGRSACSQKAIAKWNARYASQIEAREAEVARCHRKEEADDAIIRDLKRSVQDLREIATLWKGESAKFWWEAFHVQLKEAAREEKIARYWLEKHDVTQATLAAIAKPVNEAMDARVKELEAALKRAAGLIQEGYTHLHAEHYDLMKSMVIFYNELAQKRIIPCDAAFLKRLDDFAKPANAGEA